MNDIIPQNGDMKRGFKYPIAEREIYLSDSAARAGEEAFGRPSDLNDRNLPKESGDMRRALQSTGVPPREYVDLGHRTLDQAEMRECRTVRTADAVLAEEIGKRALAIQALKRKAFRYQAVYICTECYHILRCERKEPMTCGACRGGEFYSERAKAVPV